MFDTYHYLRALILAKWMQYYYTCYQYVNELYVSCRVPAALTTTQVILAKSEQQTNYIG